MSYRIFNSGDMVVIIDTDDWEIEKFPLDNIWYSYNNLEAPIKYSLNQTSPERPIILSKPYTEFRDKNGSGFDNDIILQTYLDSVLSKKETPESIEVIKRDGDALLKTFDTVSQDLLSKILHELKGINLHLTEITEKENINN